MKPNNNSVPVVDFKEIEKNIWLGDKAMYNCLTSFSWDARPPLSKP